MDQSFDSFGPPLPSSMEMTRERSESDADEESREAMFQKLIRRRALSMQFEARHTELPSEFALDPLFTNNVRWARKVSEKHPEFFENLAKQQNPDYLWIGCADSRVAANEIVGLIPGELFVHRNVANIVAHTDFNCLSVLQYAIDCLKVKHVIVCGHYGCGGVLATLKGARVGLVDNWLRHVDDVMVKHRRCLECFSDEVLKGNHLCELNAIEQALNVCKTTVVRDAWARGQKVTVHAVIYGMQDGLLRNLNMSCASMEESMTKYKFAVSHLPESAVGSLLEG